MGKWLEKYAGSIRFWVLILVSVYLGYALYFAVYGLQFSLQLTSDHYVYGLVTKDPWWWILLYYGSEGVAGSVAIVLRAIGGFFAFYAAFLWWRKKDAAFPTIRKNVCRALLLEAGFFLALIPSIIAAFAYNLTSEYLFYFDHTPERILLFGTAIPCLVIVLVVPPLLLKLRAKIKHEEPTTRNHKMERPNRHRLFICRVLVQLHYALGSNNGTIPTRLPGLRLRIPHATNKLPKFFHHGFRSSRNSTNGFVSNSSRHQKTTTKNQLDKDRDNNGSFWQLLPLQHPLLLPHRQLRSTPKRLVRSNRTTPQSKPMGTNFHLRWITIGNFEAKLNKKNRMSKFNIIDFFSLKNKESVCIDPKAQT